MPESVPFLWDFDQVKLNSVIRLGLKNSGALSGEAEANHMRTAGSGLVDSTERRAGDR